MTSIQEHTLPAPEGLQVVDRVLDVGAGIRPMQWYRPVWHVCVEPFSPYVAVLEAGGYKVWCRTALEVFEAMEGDGSWVDSIYLLDVIEHMRKEDAWRVLALAREAARCQVVVYTPVGFVEQTEDVWKLGGEYWQTHRSGWQPVEFDHEDGWVTQLFMPSRRRPPEGFYAIWDSNQQTSI